MTGALVFVGLLPEPADDHLIKRVVGMPGDRVVCCDAEQRLTVNGAPVDEPYVYPGSAPSEMSFDITVPDDAVWVMGDNRGRSADSRYNQDGPYDGFVPLDLVVGRAYTVVWPVSHWSWLGTPSSFDRVPDAQGAR